MTNDVHVGVKVPNWGTGSSPAALSATAGVAESSGFDSVWVSDHVVMPATPSGYPGTADGRPPFEPSDPFQDPIVALTWVAAQTSEVQLGTGVLVLPLRRPVVLAKQVGTLDSLSAGRVILGVGAGWMRGEFELVGASWSTRGRQMDEAIDSLRRCWSPDPFLLNIDGIPTPAAMRPKPCNGPQVPILVGGHSPAALRRAASLADGWYGSNLTPAELGGIVGELGEYVAPGRKRPMVGLKLPQDLRDPVTAVRDYRDVGAEFVVFDFDFSAMSVDEACARIEEVGLRLDLRSSPRRRLEATRSDT